MVDADSRLLYGLSASDVVVVGDGVLSAEIAATARTMGPDVTLARPQSAPLADRGFDPVYGARPLRRLIQSAIGDPLARELLAGEITDGDTVEVGMSDDGGTLVPTKREP